MTGEAVETASPAGESAESTISGAQVPNDVQQTNNEQPNIEGAQPPQYTPNFRYKAALQEKELDEFWRPLIKDKDSESKVKEVFQKIDAFDFMKQKRSEIEDKYNSLHGDFQNQNQTVSRFNDSVKGNDLSSAFRIAGISREQVFKWAQKEIQMMELPPEQRQAFEEAQALKDKNYGFEQQVAHLQSMYEEQAVQARTMQLDTALNRPTVQQFAEKWDSNSEPGAFRQFVVDEAKKIYHESGRDITADQAVGLVMQRFGKFLNVGDATVPPSQAGVQASQNAKPTIPNITGKAASPIKQVPKSLDDLKKIAKKVREAESRGEL